MSEKMQTGRTYNRPPSKSHGVVSSGGTSAGSAGKVVGRKGPQVVNNSTQGRGIPKQAPKGR